MRVGQRVRVRYFGGFGTINTIGTEHGRDYISVYFAERGFSIAVKTEDIVEVL